MRSSHSKRQKTRAVKARATQTVGCRSIVPAQLTGAVCISTIVGGVLLCPGAARAQSQGGPAGPVQSINGPSVSILQPTYADILHGHVSVLIAVQANKFAPKTVEMFVDGRSATGGPQELDASPSTGFDWDTTIFTDGPHVLTVRVTDTQGFIGQSEVQVYINNGHKRDDSPPSINWLNVTDGEVMKGTVHINLKASDDFGVKYIFVSINPAATPKQKPALHEYFLNRPPYSVAFDTTTLPDGLYVLDALAYDALENEGKAPEREFGILNNGINPTMASTLSVLAGRGLETAQQPAQAALAEAPSPAVPAAGYTAPVAVPNQGAMPTPKNEVPANVAAGGSLGGQAAAPNAAPDTRIAENTVRPVQPVQAPEHNEAPAPDSLSFVPRVTVGALSDPRSLSDRAVLAPEVQRVTRDSMPVESLAMRSVPTAPAPVARTVAESPRIATESPRVASPAPVAVTPRATAPRIAQATPGGAVRSPRPSSGASSKQNASGAAVTAAPAPSPANARRLAELAPGANGSTVKTAAHAAAGQATEYAFNLAPSAPTAAAPPPVAGQTVAAMPGLGLSELGPLAPRFSPDDASVTLAVTMSPELMVAPGLGRPVAAAALEEARTTTPHPAERPQPWLAAAPAPAKHTLGVAARSAAMPVPQVWPQSASSRISTGVNAMESHSNPLRLNAPYSALKARSMARFAPARPVALPVIDVRQQTVPTRGSRISVTAVASPKTSHEAPSRVTAFAALPQRVAPRADSRPAIVIIGSRYDTRNSSYRAAHDESLAAAAARLGVTPALLASVNGLPENSTIAAGTKLSVPRTFSVSYAGKQVQSDVPGVMVGSTSTAAFRFLFEAQGGKVAWDGAHHRVIATNGGQQVTLEIGSRAATVNDKKVMMDLAAYLLSGRTMVPVRFFEKALNAKVEWEPSSGRMLVSIDNSKHVG